MSNEQINDDDEKILNQIESIENNVKETQPLISSSKSLDHLLSYYEENELPGFIEGIKFLSTKYPRMRTVRGDGNCFYRSLLFSYLEEIINGLKNPEPIIQTKTQLEYQNFLDTLRKSKDELVSIGYDEFTFDIFYETLIEFLENLPNINIQDLCEHFTQQNSADAYTWYMRLLTAGYLKTHHERFYPFINMDDYYYVDMNAFCQREVEPMGKECEHLQVLALTEYLHVNVTIEYLDGRPRNIGEDIVKSIQFPSRNDDDNNDNKNSSKENIKENSSVIEIHLLYRPGHYDILYTSNE